MDPREQGRDRGRNLLAARCPHSAKSGGSARNTVNVRFGGSRTFDENGDVAGFGAKRPDSFPAMRWLMDQRVVCLGGPD